MTLNHYPKIETQLPMPKLTQKFIKNQIQHPERGQVIYRDDVLRGFGLRVTHGSMSYIAERRVNGINRRITIAAHCLMTPELARREARKLLSAMASGLDPTKEGVKQNVLNVTLEEVLEKYLATRTLRPNSVRSFKQILTRCLGDWLSKPIIGITREMVETRHRDLTKVTKQNTSGKAQANLAMERLSVLLNFAANNYEVDGQPVLISNPVRRLSQNRLWHRINRRQGTIPDHKLTDWYKTVMALRQKQVRDYLLVLMLTGLRRNEAATLQWSDIDLEARVLTVRSEIAKNHREHRLPLSDFLVELFMLRKMGRGESIFVFPGRGGKHHMIDSGHVISQIGEKIGCRHVLHDLRRSFLTMAERLDVPHYVLKKLVNHVATNDVTAGYIVVDVERIRQHMSRITESFLALVGGSISDLQAYEMDLQRK